MNVAFQQDVPTSLTELRFETGKITIKSSTILPADTLAMYQKLFGRKMDAFTRLSGHWEHDAYAISSERLLKIDQNESNKNKFLI